MSLFLILWFANVCDNIHNIVEVLLILFGCLAVAGIVWCFAAWEDTELLVKACRKQITKPIVITFIIVAVIHALLPTSKTIYIATGITAIASASVSAANSDTAKKALQVLNKKLDEYLNESKEK